MSCGKRKFVLGFKKNIIDDYASTIILLVKPPSLKGFGGFFEKEGDYEQKVLVQRHGVLSNLASII